MIARRLLLPLLLLAALVSAPTARADGPPITALGAGPDGVVAADGDQRLAALETASGTVVTRSQIDGGRVLGAGVLEGRWGVPLVAHDGTSSGLSADGETLVLTRLRTYPGRRSSFAVVDAEALRLRDTVDLPGQWSFDAVSPDGRWLYLIEQLSRRDRSRYAVRVYDLANDRLLPEPVVDPREPDEPMRGLPVTRATGPSGRWEYTLYAGGEHPFVHALDTVKRTSLCLDLPHGVAHGRRIWGAQLAVRGAKVAVLHRGTELASIARRPRSASLGGGPPWAAAVLGATGLLVAAGAVRRAARRRAA
jgi:hypothetical protein